MIENSIFSITGQIPVTVICQVDRRGLIGLQRFPIEACPVGAVQIGQCIGATDVLDGSMNT